MTKYINLFILFAGVIIAVADYIVGHTRCTIVGLSLILFSYLNQKIKYIRLIIPKTILVSVMFWVLRFSLFSFAIVLNLYHFIFIKLIIFCLLLLFFLAKFPHHPFKFYKTHVLVIFLITVFFLDLIITYQVDRTIFTDPFFYLTLIPILFISNDKISYVSKQSSASNSQRIS